MAKESRGNSLHSGVRALSKDIGADEWIAYEVGMEIRVEDIVGLACEDVRPMS